MTAGDRQINPPRPWDHVILGQSRALILVGALDTLIEAALELQEAAPENPLAPIAVRRGRAALAALENP